MREERLTAASAAFLLTRANAKLLDSAGFNVYERRPLVGLNGLLEDYLFRIAKTARKVAIAQRKNKVGLAEIEIMLSIEGIHTGVLESEMERVKGVQFVLEVDEAAVTTHGFSENAEIKRILGPALDGARDKRPYVPSHLPPFPAKHTYLATPHYSSRPSSPRRIREMATEEARQAEVALQKIIDAFGGEQYVQHDMAWKACWEEMGFHGEVARNANAESNFNRKSRKRAPLSRS